MMSVYIVMQHVYYEGDTVMAVFSTEEKAEEFRKQREERNQYSDVSYWILEEVVL